MFENCVFRIIFVILFCNLLLRCAIHFYQDFVPPCICLDKFERRNVKWHSDALQTQKQTITVGLMAEYIFKSLTSPNMAAVPSCGYSNCLLLSLCPTRVIVKASDGSHKRCSNSEAAATRFLAARCAASCLSAADAVPPLVRPIYNTCMLEALCESRLCTYSKSDSAATMFPGRLLCFFFCPSKRRRRRLGCFRARTWTSAHLDFIPLLFLI